VTSRLPGFYRLDVVERRRRLLDAARLPAEGFAAVEPGALALEVADGMIENVVGTYALPFAVAVNFVVDAVDVFVPMAVEEPSIVAAASNAARMTRPGGFTTKATSPTMIGQIQVVHVPDVGLAAAALRNNAEAILAEARTLVPRLLERGGGPVGFDVRVLATTGPDGGVIVAHLLVDVCDAMGANLVNTLCEALADRVAALANGRVGLRILSNLTDARTVTSTCVVDEPDPEVRAGIAAASRFAELDPYRATTHNKGIMNGIDAVLVATGQDWRAVEAGAHAYAARSGVYRPLATWWEDGDTLRGELGMPLAVGTVGGALRVHPSAKLALQLANASTAERLAAVAAAAGLATNLAALRALATEGIQRGHMRLHARATSQNGSRS
jgi:hydroxymethylglutaryl-CoA reductase